MVKRHDSCKLFPNGSENIHQEKINDEKNEAKY